MTQPGKPSMWMTAGVTAGGSLAWLGWVWAATYVVVAVVLGVNVVRDHHVDASLWQDLGAGWQRWILGAAGITMISSFARMLVTNGVTRARLSASAAVTLVVLGVAGATFATVGYAVEDAVFDWQGWDHVLDEGGDAGGIRALADVWLETLLLLGAWFASGWLIGAGRGVWGKDATIVVVPLAAIPAVLAEVLLHSSASNPVFGFVQRALDGVNEPHAAIGLPLTIAVLVVAVAVAGRLTREVPIR